MEPRVFTGPPSFYSPSSIFLSSPFLSLQVVSIFYPGTSSRSNYGVCGSAVSSCSRLSLWCILNNHAITRVFPPTYLYGVSQKRSGGVVSNRPRKCRHGIASHTFPLAALVRSRRTPPALCPGLGCSLLSELAFRRTTHAVHVPSGYTRSALTLTSYPLQTLTLWRWIDPHHEQSQRPKC